MLIKTYKIAKENFADNHVDNIVGWASHLSSQVSRWIILSVSEVAEFCLKVSEFWTFSQTLIRFLLHFVEPTVLSNGYSLAQTR